MIIFFCSFVFSRISNQRLSRGCVVTCIYTCSRVMMCSSSNQTALVWRYGKYGVYLLEWTTISWLGAVALYVSSSVNFINTLFALTYKLPPTYDSAIPLPGATMLTKSHKLGISQCSSTYLYKDRGDGTQFRWAFTCIDTWTDKSCCNRRVKSHILSKRQRSISTVSNTVWSFRNLTWSIGRHR